MAMALIEKDVLLADHCRFHVGGPADYFAHIATRVELQQALAFAAQHGLRYFVYGGGSNLFFDDTGYRGLVIQLYGGTVSKLEDGVTVLASAGYELPLLVRQVAHWDLGGLEFLGNIPGSVGGAVVGNAGCYGKAIADVLVSAEVFNADTGQSSILQPSELGFAYRHSRLKSEPQYVVLSAALRAVPRHSGDVNAELEAELASRLNKHPHEAWCAGSFFKNPSRENPAWRVITDAGVAHARIGGAALSELHANFLLNTGGATSAEIIALVRLVQTAVYKRCGIHLATEVRYIGPEGIVEL
jgi:UDP-N-acetylmuramate dehydrogenase